MTVTSKIRRQGGAAVMTIPPALLKLMDVGVGTEVSLSVAEGELIVRPISSSRKRFSFAESLQGVEAVAELNARTAWARDGDPMGRELG
ncbi:MAG: AbrB/MazE/SpoVT family DNA-binding domain-containing protein [Rhizobiaceae bacterium]